jgi:hypothetical protein
MRFDHEIVDIFRIKNYKENKDKKKEAEDKEKNKD